ncbi:hypothetical protein C0081_01845 [Cohaesibacter celericrescens]|uniref:Uncharacterized protein n=1 Tax=Cohaesibacter celericrescens TaxID=2067669 RepID=A0A2N5XWW5_9HYPH|nr:hypothetical protein C0081_01845 [Cohaesibacter celericrescens]
MLLDAAGFAVCLCCAIFDKVGVLLVGANGLELSATSKQLLACRAMYDRNMQCQRSNALAKGQTAHAARSIMVRVA